MTQLVEEHWARRPTLRLPLQRAAPPMMTRRKQPRCGATLAGVGARGRCDVPQCTRRAPTSVPVLPNRRSRAQACHRPPQRRPVRVGSRAMPRRSRGSTATTCSDSFGRKIQAGMRSKLPLQGVYPARRRPVEWLLRVVPLKTRRRKQPRCVRRARERGRGRGAGGTTHNDPRGVSTYSRPLSANTRSRAPKSQRPRRPVRVGSPATPRRRCALRASLRAFAPLACSLARAWQSHEAPPRASTLSPLIGEDPESPAAYTYAGADAAAAAAARVIAKVREIIAHGRPR
jgi:hypothetical protein